MTAREGTQSGPVHITTSVTLNTRSSRLPRQWQRGSLNVASVEPGAERVPLWVTAPDAHHGEAD